MLWRDALRWADAVAERMKSADPALRRQLAAEAGAYAACLLVGRIPHGADREVLRQQVLITLREVWEETFPDDDATKVAGWLDDPERDRTASGCPVLRAALQVHERPNVDHEQAAREFQRATGLGGQALVGGGPNLAAILFYHRVFLAARQSPAFNASHRAPIVRAAQQCREQFERVLEGRGMAAPRSVESSMRPLSTGGSASRFLPGAPAPGAH